MPVSQPVDDLTTAGTTEIHQINHNNGWNVTHQEHHQHDQICFCQLALPLDGALQCSVLLVLALIQFLHFFYLVLY